MIYAYKAGYSHIYDVNYLVNIKKKYPDFILQTLPDTLLKNSSFNTKQEIIDYINSL